MKSVFADTSYYLAFLGASDQWHAAALSWSDRIRCPRFTSEFVLAEVGNTLNRGDDRMLFSDLLRVLHQDEKTTVIPATHQLFENGCELFANRLDKEWSITDCISFVIMTSHGIQEALAADRHFIQAGFRSLLLEP